MSFNRDRNFTDKPERPIPTKYNAINFPHSEGRYNGGGGEFFVGGQHSANNMRSVLNVRRPNGEKPFDRIVKNK